MAKGDSTDIGNHPSYLKRQAVEALKAGKMLEARAKSKGGKYVKTGLRSWTLKKRNEGGNDLPDSDFLGQKDTL